MIIIFPIPMVMITPIRQKTEKAERFRCSWGWSRIGTGEYLILDFVPFSNIIIIITTTIAIFVIRQESKRSDQELEDQEEGEGQELARSGDDDGGGDSGGDDGGDGGDGVDGGGGDGECVHDSDNQRSAPNERRRSKISRRGAGELFPHCHHRRDCLPCTVVLMGGRVGCGRAMIANLVA